MGITTIAPAQTPLVVDAGKDTNYCLSSTNGLLNLGGNPTSTGGVAPYGYSWTIYNKTTKQPLTILTDSNINLIANPSFTMIGGNGLFVFKVSVTDSKGNKASDSITIGISSFIEILCCGIRESLNGDSVELSTHIENGIKPYTYKWMPTIGLSNPNIEKPKAKPTYPYITYYVTVTDSLGCSITDWGMTVTDIQNGDINTGFVSYKNPISNSGTMNFTSELIGSKLQIVSVGGEVQYQTKVEEESIPLGSLIPTAGIYFYTITTTQDKVVSGSFVRE
jgi:hypothetical protein